MVERVFKSLGMEVRTNVLVGGLELDLVAIEGSDRRPLVYVVEAKSRPKWKLLEQLLSRVELSDYVYAALPLRHYSYLLEVPEPAGSLAVDPENQVVYEIRRPAYVGNGWKLLKLLGSRPPRDNRWDRAEPGRTDLG